MKWILLLATLTLSLLGSACKSKQSKTESKAATTSSPSDQTSPNQAGDSPTVPAPDQNLQFIVPVTGSSISKSIQPGSVYRYKNNKSNSSIERNPA